MESVVIFLTRKLSRGVYLLIQRYFRHNVGVQSAALAFYLLFMLFPFLIFISALLGLLDLNVTAILLSLGEFLPRDVVDILRAYLLHVSQNPSPKLMVFGLFFSIWFPMRATNALMVSVRTAYHLGPPKRALVHRLKTLLYTVVLISTIALTLALMTVGDRLLGYAVGNFRLPLFLAELWARMRFPAAAVVGYFALAALAAWMGVSWLYAVYVDNFANYSLLYGSIGTVVVLMIWLYMSANVLILGAELNGALLALRKEREG